MIIERSQNVATVITSPQLAAQPPPTVLASHQNMPPAADSNDNTASIIRQSRKAEDRSGDIGAQHQETQTSKKPKEDDTNLITHQPMLQGSNNGSLDTTQEPSLPETLRPEIKKYYLKRKRQNDPNKAMRPPMDQ